MLLAVGEVEQRADAGVEPLFERDDLFPDEATDLVAQEAKLDLVCRKLTLAPGMRVLDVAIGTGLVAREEVHINVAGPELVGLALHAPGRRLRPRHSPRDCPKPAGTATTRGSR